MAEEEEEEEERPQQQRTHAFLEALLFCPSPPSPPSSPSRELGGTRRHIIMVALDGQGWLGSTGSKTSSSLPTPDGKKNAMLTYTHTPHTH
jgi:hypothetical protein